MLQVTPERSNSRMFLMTVLFDKSDLTNFYIAGGRITPELPADFSGIAKLGLLYVSTYGNTVASEAEA
jgi:hypothetical protein